MGTSTVQSFKVTGHQRWNIEIFSRSNLVQSGFTATLAPPFAGRAPGKTADKHRK
jgi:hypothetical protein